MSGPGDPSITGTGRNPYIAIARPSLTDSSPGKSSTIAKFDEFWKSKERKQDLADLRPNECERCQFSGKIKSVLAVMKRQRHVEFP